MYIYIYIYIYIYMPRAAPRRRARPEAICFFTPESKGVQDRGHYFDYNVRYYSHYYYHFYYYLYQHYYYDCYYICHCHYYCYLNSIVIICVIIIIIIIIIIGEPAEAAPRRFASPRSAATWGDCFMSFFSDIL